MNDDTISRQAAIDALNGEFTITGRENAKTIQAYINGVDKKLRELPSAERRGRWINCGWSIKCSICDYDMPFSVRNYCPNCGSRMDLEGDAE